MSRRDETEQAKMARRRRYLAIALLIAVGWYGVHRYLDYREAKQQARVAACEGAKWEVRQDWYRYLADLSLHQMKAFVDTPNEKRDHDAVERNLDELKTSNPPDSVTVEDLEVLRALSGKWPQVEPPDLAAMEAKLALCRSE